MSLSLVGVRMSQLLETWKADGPSSVLNKALFFNKKIIPFEKDLSRLPPLRTAAKNSDLGFAGISPECLGAGKLRYDSRNRRLRVVKNFRMGYGGFALVRADEIIGDVWYCTKGGEGRGFRHPDLQWLEWTGIRLGDADVYLFEMYVKAGERGGGAVNFMLWNALNALKEKGCKRAYGYCTADNTPALWVHRTLGYRELERIRIHRVFSATFRSIAGPNPRRLFRAFDLS